MVLLEAAPSANSNSYLEPNQELGDQSLNKETPQETLKRLVVAAKIKLLHNQMNLQERSFELPAAPHVFDGFFGNGNTRIRISTTGFPGTAEGHGMSIVFQEEHFNRTVNTLEIQTVKDPIWITPHEVKRLTSQMPMIEYARQTISAATGLKKEEYDSYLTSRPAEILKPNIPSLVANLSGVSLAHSSR